MFWLDSGHQQIDYLDGIEAAVLYGGQEEGVVEGDGGAFGGEVESEGAEERSRRPAATEQRREEREEKERDGGWVIR